MPEHYEASERELAFVEDFALAMERLGLVRMTGRVIGWLLICDPPEQTFAQIADALQASKGSISTALKFLTTAGWAQRRSRPGDRKDYYTIKAGAMIELIRQQSVQYAGFADFLGKSLDDLDEPQRTDRLRDMHELFAWIGEEMPALVARWDRDHANRSSR
jgi:DNA-binding transcriptional regulator GbsR (MarR family)